MESHRIGRLHAVALALAPAAFAGCAFAQPPSAPREAPDALAVSLGCTSCHAAAPAAGAPPAAPSWREIAARYRGDAGAGDRLARIVVEGSGERHWKGRAMFEAMLPNAPWVSHEEARAVVRWILAR